MRRLAMGMALLGLLLVPGLSQALGLGDIEVRSALNQPLNAEIELVEVRRGEMEDLQVRLAPEDLYRRLGIDRTAVLTQLRFQPETLPDGRHVIRVTTREAVREPFINFLVEAAWPAGRLVREYTLLLDPPVMFEAREAPAPAAPAPEVRPAEPRPAPAPRVEAPRPDAPATYRVQRGDTLWAVARDVRPGTDVSVEQMMLALLRTNPGAFTDNNINNLLSGQVLRVPDRAEIDRLSRAEAAREVARQNDLWREYRARVAQETAPQVPAPPVPAEPAPAVAQPDDPVSPDDARLEILAAREAQDAVAEMERELGLARETAEARGREVEDLRSRIVELETLLERRERLLELTNQQMAELQTRMDRLEGREPAEPIAEPAPGVAEVEPAPDVAELEPAPDAVEEAPAVTLSEAERMAAAPITETPVAPETPAPAPETAAPAPEPRAAAPAPAPPAEPARPVSMIDDLMANPNAMMIVGLVALLIILLLWLMVRRARAGRASEPALAVATPAGTEARFDAGGAGALAGAAAGGAAAGVLIGTRDDDQDQDVQEAAEGTRAEGVESLAGDTIAEPPEQAPGEAPAEAGGESPAVVSEEHEEITNDDTIAEVDVYLAYGLYSQAEDLLNKAVEEHPERIDYRFKLAETHFATRNTEAFEANAEGMHDALAGRPSELWERVQAMGQDLSPDNPLFSGAPSMALSESGLTPEVDLDLGMEELEDTLEDVDLEADLDEPESAQAERMEGDEAADTVLEEPAGEAPVAAEDEALEFDLGDLELDPESLDVDLLDEDAARTEDAGPESAVAEAPLTGEDQTKLEELPELDVPGEPDINLDDTVLGESEPADLPTGADMPEDDTQILDEDFADVDFLGGAEAEDDLLAPDEESADLPSGDEVSTKLDLARAYIDMGDSEGARSTLDEVIAEGDDAQKREAQSLMDQLG